jgi:predicted nucleic acid-binding protein
MDAKVVDASAIAALLLGEPQAEDIAQRLGDARLIAPALLAFELANVCLVKRRRRPDQASTLTAAFGLRDRLAMEEIAVDHEGVLQLAAATDLTAYDASYLWLARETGAELITLDRRLAQAASM